MLTVVFAAAGGLLLVAGAVKLRRPEHAAGALRSLGLPGPGSLVRLLGALELAVGLGALVSPGLAAAPLALLYAGFTAFVGTILWRGLPLASCGCLGETETRPSGVHVTVTLLAAVAGGLALVVSPPGVAGVIGADPLRGAVLTLALATLTYVVYLSLAFLPGALWAYRAPAVEE
ncbi:MAG TPA: MauE/DoxX family redox-associated membrane protein [Thermoleophilaceae bacterium]|nr:MauE/DoxX family redox-associated membrane protein [Thermoleophilaceae bacterium]